MKWLHDIDGRLVTLFQDAYLWAWDRTGVYVASLMFAAYVGDHVCWGPLRPLHFFFMAAVGVWCGYRYVVQSKDLRRLNDMQREWRDFRVRHYFTVFGFAMLSIDAISVNAWHFASDFLMLTWSYLGCVQVRERDPKEFLSSQKLAEAR